MISCATRCVRVIRPPDLALAHSGCVDWREHLFKALAALAHGSGTSLKEVIHRSAFADTVYPKCRARQGYGLLFTVTLLPFHRHLRDHSLSLAIRLVGATGPRAVLGVAARTQLRPRHVGRSGGLPTWSVGSFSVMFMASLQIHGDYGQPYRTARQLNSTLGNLPSSYQRIRGRFVTSLTYATADTATMVRSRCIKCGSKGVAWITCLLCTFRLRLRAPREQATLPQRNSGLRRLSSGAEADRDEPGGRRLAAKIAAVTTVRNSAPPRLSPDKTHAASHGKTMPSTGTLFLVDQQSRRPMSVRGDAMAPTKPNGPAPATTAKPAASSTQRPSRAGPVVGEHDTLNRLLLLNHLGPQRTAPTQGLWQA